MRIAQVCPFFLPVEGGVESHVLNISKELLRRGNEVHVFTCSMTRDSEKLPSTSDIDSIYVHRYPPIVVLGEFGSLWPGFMIDVISGDFDVIHAHSFRHPHTDLSAIAAKLSHSRSVLTSHSPFHPPGVRSPLARGLVPVYDHLLAPMVLKNFDRVVSLTANEAQALAALGAPRENLTVIPNGVEDVHFESIPIDGFLSKFSLTGSRVILYLGRVNRTKGLDVLLKAFALASPSLNGVRLVVAGPASSKEEIAYLSSLRLLAQKLGISSKVTFTGRLSEEEKLEALQCCTVFVLPSVYEPFGIVILEAAAHAKAIVSTRTDGPASIIEDGSDGILVTPGDSIELGKRLSELLNDDDLLKKLSEAARHTAERYRWRKVVDTLVHVYSDSGIAA